MGFKEGFNKFIQGTKKTWNNALDYGARKISNSSSFSIDSREDLDELIEKSATTEFQDKKTGELKYFKHKSILIIAEEYTEFFRSISLSFPILKTKAFSQNITIMLSKEKIEGVDYNEEFGISEFPIMIVFEDKKIYKKIIGEENIEKFSKSFKMNIEELIEQF